MLWQDKARGADVFCGREPQGRTFNDARRQAIEIAGYGVTRVHGEDPGQAHTLVQRLAAQILLALPGGEWWAVHDRLHTQLLAAMSSERIGAQHLSAPLCLSALAKLGVSACSTDELQAVAASLCAWDRGKGIVVAAFVDGIISACKVLGTENKVNSFAMGEREREMEKEEEISGLASPLKRSVQFPYYDSSGSPVEGRVEAVMRENSRQLSQKDLLKVHSLTNAVARKFESDVPDARAKDWRMSDRMKIREAEVRNNPAVTKTWQTIQMPTGFWMHTEQLGHYDNPSRLRYCSNTPPPPRGGGHSRLSTPRIDPYAVGHLTNSELLVFRSLKKSMAADQPFSKLNSFQRLATPMTPRHKPLASALRTRTINRNAHLVPELAVPLMDTGHRLHESGSQTERAMRATKPNYFPTVPLLSQGGFRPHPSWAAPASSRS